MAVRRITTDTKVRIRKLVDLIYNFLPFSTHSTRAPSFIKIFSESHIEKYLERGASKKQKLQIGWENVLRYHKKLPYTLIRKIIPASIEYRRYKRNPLKKEELHELINCLDILGIKMKAELKKIDLDETMPEVRIPPRELLANLKKHISSLDIEDEVVILFENGHYNEAVRKASELFEVKVQKLSNLEDIGKNLMAKAFKLDNPKIKLNNLSTENEKAIQEGYMFLAMGMMRAIRNIFSHGDEKQRSPEEAYEMLIFINWLFRQLP